MTTNVCRARGCNRRTEAAHVLCITHELAGTSLALPEEPARRDQATVVVLTIREATALRTALLALGGDADHLQRDTGDLGRAWRVLNLQLSWLESNIKGSGRPRVNGSAA